MAGFKIQDKGKLNPVMERQQKSKKIQKPKSSTVGAKEQGVSCCCFLLKPSTPIFLVCNPLQLFLLPLLPTNQLLRIYGMPVFFFSDFKYFNDCICIQFKSLQGTAYIIVSSLPTSLLRVTKKIITLQARKLIV